MNPKSPFARPPVPALPGLPPGMQDAADMSQRVQQLEIAAVNNELSLILYLQLHGPLPEALVKRVKGTIDLLPNSSRDFVTLRNVVADTAVKWKAEEAERQAQALAQEQSSPED